MFSDAACESVEKANISTSIKIHRVRTRAQIREGRIWQTQDITELCVEKSQAEKSRAVNYSTKYYRSVNREEQVHEIKSNTFHLGKQQDTCGILVQIETFMLGRHLRFIISVVVGEAMGALGRLQKINSLNSAQL